MSISGCPFRSSLKPGSNDGQLHVSGESGDGLVDYYGHEFNDYDSYIHPDLEAWAEKHGCFWEWNDPGSICLAEA